MFLKENTTRNLRARLLATADTRFVCLAVAIPAKLVVTSSNRSCRWSSRRERLQKWSTMRGSLIPASVNIQLEDTAQGSMVC